MTEEKKEVKIHGIYKHFKNKYYIVEDVAFHSETKENMLFTEGSMRIIHSGFVRKTCSCLKSIT